MFDYYASEEPLISLDELCDYLNIGKNTAYKLLNSGAIKAWKIGRIWKIPHRAVQDYIFQETKMKVAQW